MSEMMNNVKTLNSAVRTAMLVGITGVVGYSGYLGYDNYVKPGFQAKQAVADLETMKVEFSKQAEQLQKIEKRNERLETSMKLLKVDRRVAHVKILEKEVDEKGEPYMEVRFSEVDPDGNVIGSPRDFTIQGDRFYVDGWVATFEDSYVENADELRSASMFVFKSIYGDAERPKDGQRLDIQSAESGPPGIYKSAKKNEFEQKIWGDFWTVANDKSNSDS